MKFPALTSAPGLLVVLVVLAGMLTGYLCGAGHGASAERERAQDRAEAESSRRLGALEDVSGKILVGQERIEALLRGRQEHR